MKEIGLFYAMNAAKTSHIAEKIREKLGHKEEIGRASCRERV